MTTGLTLKQVLEEAIHKEIISQRLYQSLRQRVTDEAAKDAFKELVRQEESHQQLLERYLNGELKEGALSVSQPVDFKIVEYLGAPETSDDIKLKDAFLLAATREKIANELYLNLAGLHPPGEVKRLFEDLAAQELEHKRRVEALFTEVAFPQTDGG